MSRILLPGLMAAAMLSCMGASPASARVCKPSISGVGHGQAIEKSRPDYGVPYARRQAARAWRAAVIAADGGAFANLSKARAVSYSEDRGAGQIYITLTAAPCK